MIVRLPIVGVMGSGRHEHASKAEALGRWLAAQRVHLLTGGGRGVSEAVSRAFHAIPGRVGLVVGIVPCAEAPDVPRSGYPNPWVEVPIYTHLPYSGEQGTSQLSRNHINVLSSNIVIALPGGAGTASEVELAVRYRRPVAAYLDHRSDIPSLPAEVPVFSDLDCLQNFVRSRLPP
jgi:uncharacterized protein (TIGR00725 family)